MTPATRRRLRPRSSVPPAAPRRVAPGAPRRLLPWLAAAPILLLTLHPSPGDRALGWDGCLLCGERGTADALLNLLLFAPFGAALALRRLSPAHAAVLGALFSVGVETAQLFVPGRDPSPPDLVFNTLGTLGGVALGLRVRALLRPSRRAAGRLALLWSAAVAVAVAATGALSRPAPGSGPLWVQWTPRVGDAPPYPGAVVAARVGTRPLPPGRLAAPGELRAALLAGAPLTVEAVAAPPPGEPSTLLRLADAGEREILRVAVVGPDLLVRVRTAGDGLRFDRAPFRVRGALAGVTAGERIRVTLRLRGAAMDVSVDGGSVDGGSVDGRWVRRVGPDAGHGWALLGAALEPVADARTLGSGWTALLFLPLGFWARRDRWGAAAVALAVVALLGVPAVVGLLPTTAVLFAGAAVGAATGRVLRGVVR